MPPAKTGSLKTKRKAVTHTLNKKRDILNHLIDGLFRLFIVHIKLIDLTIDLIPAKCKLKMIMSIEFLGVPRVLLRGG